MTINIELKAKDLYDIVAEEVYKYCDDTYYDTCIAKFEQSYNGKEWTDETEIVYFDDCTDIVFFNDWCEGQKYIRNIRVCHLEEVLFPNDEVCKMIMDEEYVKVVRCNDCFHYHKGYVLPKHCALTGWETEPSDYCSSGERKDDPQTYTINAGEV